MYIDSLIEKYNTVNEYNMIAIKNIAIYGAGGLGREVACLINKINEVAPIWNLIGFFDDGIEIGTQNEYGKVLGGIDELNSYTEELSIAIAIASPKIVERIVSKITPPHRLS